MTATNYQDLRILICEDEYLLAMDMAQQLSALGAEVVGIASSVSEIENWMTPQPFAANAAVLDLRFADGVAYDVIDRLQKAGAALVICSGYMVEDRPAALAHIPWLGKPVRGEDVAQALCTALDARSAAQSE